jgi:branched-chain amino acid transport system permease protein
MSKSREKALSLKGYNLISFAVLAIIVTFFLLAPLFLETYYLSVLRNSLLFAALTISWFFFSGTTKYVSLGSAAFFGTGLYFTALYLEQSVLNKHLTILPLPVIMLMAGLLNFAIAFVVGLISLRLKGMYFAIATFALGEACRGIFNYAISDFMETHYTYIPPFSSEITYYTITVTAFTIFMLIFVLYRSKLGLALRAIGENEEAAAHLGVNTSLVKTFGFAISAMCIGFMGSCYVTIFTVTSPDIAFDFQFSFLPPMMAMFGGIGSFYAPLVGAVILSLLREFLGVTLVHHFLLILGIIIVLIAEFMPEGVVNLLKRWLMIKFRIRKRTF